ncbi:MAG: T9SS type A sorting domain-containing protein [Flavobacteriales bacterium]|nr:T9SS type A sorting domain-containing protein [Flavobacteriales bacterium]
MKKLFTACLISLGIAANAQQGNVVNGDFESWSMTTIYEYPDLWSNSNVEEWRGVAGVEKSTDATVGTYSVKLRSAINPNNDTIFGYVYHGSVGSMGPDGGISYTSTFDEVTFDYQSDLPIGDTMYLFVIRFNGGSMTEMLVLPAAYGTHSTWQSNSISLSNTSQDELFLGFVLGDPMTGEATTPGSFAMVDNVMLKNGGSAATNVPDPSFESWSSQSYEGPDDWFTLNDILSGIGSENCNKSTDAHTGMYAAELTTIFAPMFGDTIPGFISMGPINMMGGGGSPFLPLAYDANPTLFSGAYKYTPVNGDQGIIYLEFYNNGSVVGSSVQYLSATAGYQTFSNALSLTMTPDSAQLVAGSGDNPGSVLLIDNFEFSGGNVSVFENVSEIEMYPNPASDYFIMRIDEEYSYEIYSMEGRRVANQTGLLGWESVDVSDLASGKYIVKINTARTSINKSLIVE